MSPNRRFTIWIASLIVLGLAALAVLYVPLRKAARETDATETEEQAQESRWPAAEELDAFLQVREALVPVYEAYGEHLEKAVDPAVPENEKAPLRVVVGSRQMVDVMTAGLGSRGMSVDRFRELTDLVYLRWWRVEGPGPVPEVELVEHLERYIGHREILNERFGSGEEGEAGEQQRQREEDLAAKQAQLEQMRPIAAADPAERLAGMPDEARTLLESHRERIAATDMGLFDSNYIVQAKQVGAAPALLTAPDG
jgi:hypothetical protein